MLRHLVAITLVLILFAGVLPHPGAAHYDPAAAPSEPIIMVLHLLDVRPKDDIGYWDFFADEELEIQANFSMIWGDPVHPGMELTQAKKEFWMVDQYDSTPIVTWDGFISRHTRLFDEGGGVPAQHSILAAHVECRPAATPINVRADVIETEETEAVAWGLRVVAALIARVGYAGTLKSLGVSAIVGYAASSATIAAAEVITWDEDNLMGRSEWESIVPSQNEGVMRTQTLKVRGGEGSMDLLVGVEWHRINDPGGVIKCNPDGGVEQLYMPSGGKDSDGGTSVPGAGIEVGLGSLPGCGATSPACGTMTAAKTFADLKTSIAAASTGAWEAQEGDMTPAILMDAVGLVMNEVVATADGLEGAEDAILAYNAAQAVVQTDMQRAVSYYEIAHGAASRAILQGTPSGTDLPPITPAVYPSSVSVQSTTGRGGAVIFDTSESPDGPQISIPGLPEGWELIEVTDDPVEEKREVEPVIELIFSKLYGDCAPKGAEPPIGPAPAPGSTEGCADGESRVELGKALEILLAPDPEPLADDLPDPRDLPDPFLKKMEERHQLIPPFPPAGALDNGFVPFSHEWWYKVWEEMFPSPPKVHYLVRPSYHIEIPLVLPGSDEKKEADEISELERRAAHEVAKTTSFKGGGKAADAYRDSFDAPALGEKRLMLQQAIDHAVAAQAEPVPTEPEAVEPLPLAGVPKELVLTPGVDEIFVITDPSPTDDEPLEVTIELPSGGEPYDKETEIFVLPVDAEPPAGAKAVGVIKKGEMKETTSADVQETALAVHLLMGGEGEHDLLGWFGMGWEELEAYLEAQPEVDLGLDPTAEPVESVIDDLTPLILDPWGVAWYVNAEDAEHAREKEREAEVKESIKKILEGMRLKIKQVGESDLLIPLSVVPDPPRVPTAEENFLAWLQGLVGPWNEQIEKGDVPAFLQQLRGESLLVTQLRSGDEARVLFELGSDRHVKSLSLLNPGEKITPDVTVDTREHVLKGLLSAKDKGAALLLALDQGTITIDDSETLGAVKNWFGTQGGRIMAKFEDAPYDIEKGQKTQIEYAVPTGLPQAFRTAPQPVTVEPWEQKYMGPPIGATPLIPGAMVAGTTTLTKNPQGLRVVTPLPGASLPGLEKSLVPNVPKEEIYAGIDQFGSTTGYTTKGNQWLMAVKPPDGYKGASRTAGWFDFADDQGTYYSTSSQSYLKHGTRASAGAYFTSGATGSTV